MSNLERQRLMSRFANEPTRPVAAMIKCAVGLAVLALLAVIGNGADSGDPRESIAGSTQSAPAGAAGAHRKEVFDDRRARFSADATPQRAESTPTDGATLYAGP
jgi:hypothetical protein